MSKKERWIQHYRSSQMILLVGEGDFSFSACLARAFGSAHNMVATSLDSEETLLRKHRSCVAHLDDLHTRGCLLLHEIDVHDMNEHPTLKDMKFDIIVFNFPHAGHVSWLCEQDAILIERHKNLLRGFFGSALQMLNEGGEIHVTHRDDNPYNQWEVEKQAQKAGLVLKEKMTFIKERYPGYHNKRGSFIDGNKKFPIENPFTFKFIVAHDHHQETTPITTRSATSDLQMLAGTHQETTLISSMIKSDNQMPKLSDHQTSSVGDPHETTLVSSETESDHQIPVLSDHDQMQSVGDPHETIFVISKTKSDDQMPAKSDHDQTPNVGDPHETILISSKTESNHDQMPTLSGHDQISAFSDHDQMPSVGDPNETTLISSKTESENQMPAKSVHDQMHVLSNDDQIHSVGDPLETALISSKTESDDQMHALSDHDQMRVLFDDDQMPSVGDLHEMK